MMAQAQLAGLEVSSIAAGSSGAVTRRQVQEPPGLHQRPAKPGESEPDTGQTFPTRAVPHNTIRKLTAARMTDAKEKIPHFYLGIECDVARATSFLKRLNSNEPETR